MRKNNIFIKVFSVIALITIMGTLSSCWDNLELNKVSLVLGVGLDADEESEDTTFTFQLNKSSPAGSTSKSGGGGEESTKYYNIETKAKGLHSAVSNVNLMLPRNLFLEHNQFILVGRDQAKKGLEDLLDAFAREIFLRAEVWVVVADEKASDVLSAELEQEKVVASGVSKMLDDLSEQNKVFQRSKFYHFMSCSKTGEAASLLPIMAKKKNVKSDVLSVEGLAIFEKFKMVGELDKKQSQAYSMIMGNYVDTADLELKMEKGYTFLNAIRIKSKITPEFDEQGKPAIKVKISFTANTGEIQGIEDMTPMEIQKYVEKEAKRVYEKEFMDCIKYTQEIGYDVFKFGEAFHKAHQKKWKTMEKDWKETYKDLKVELTVEPQIYSVGNIDSSLAKKEH